MHALLIKAGKVKDRLHKRILSEILQGASDKERYLLHVESLSPGKESSCQVNYIGVSQASEQ